MNTMLDFDALIRHFGPAAVEMSLRESDTDNNALCAICDPRMENRATAIRKWLEFYKVFQGFDGAKRDDLCATVLNWADRQGENSGLETLDALVHAHADLEAACSRVDGRRRDFISLASKALCLALPASVIDRPLPLT